MFRTAVLLFALLAAAAQAGATTVLFDFETDRDIAVWHNENSDALGADKKLEASEQFAASGQFSMQFRTPAWRPEEHDGASTWPAFEGKPPITDWSKYDRLVMEIVNVTDAPQKLMLFLSDSQKPTRSGLNHRELLAPKTHARAIIDLAKGLADKGVNPADIAVMHFFTENPPEDLVLHIDRLLLLEPDEAIPALPTSYLKDIASLQSEAVEALATSLDEAAGRIAGVAEGSPRVSAWAGDQVGALRQRLDDLLAMLTRGDEQVLQASAELLKVQDAVAHTEAVVAARMEFEKVREQVETAPGSAEGLGAGFAFSMEKVLPRAGVPELRMTREASLSVARNEKESLQLVVIPFERDLREVQVRATELKTAGGAALPVAALQAVPVGYVETKAVPPYGSSHVGWWPDPILTFMDAADIAAGDAQAFWVSVKAPEDQGAGVYSGKLEVSAEGGPLMAFDLSVRVYDFAVPKASPLPLAITFAPHDHPTAATSDEQTKWRTQPQYPLNTWREHKSEWVDFLADYYITYDSLYAYSGWAPDFDELLRLKEEGRLGTFNLGYYSKCPTDAEGEAAWRRATIDVLRPRYERAKELGLLEYAYIYGCDEHPKDEFPFVEKAASILKAEFPDVLVMTTTYDHSYGRETVIKSMDAWCPLTPRFVPEAAEEVRAEGKQVWWYICCGPHHPHANMFVEYPAIEGRLLMGPMTAKLRPDGFLYYQISIWNSEKPIEGGPFTDWDPRSWTSYHGDGSWTCVGPGGTPLATIRLENFRDGLEDYAYHKLLGQMITEARASGTQSRQWLQKAQEALEVPDELVQSAHAYSRDPAELYRWRDRMAEVIEEGMGR